MTPEREKEIRGFVQYYNPKHHNSYDSSEWYLAAIFELLAEIDRLRTENTLLILNDSKEQEFRILKKERDIAVEQLTQFADLDNPNELKYICYPKSEYMQKSREVLAKIRGELRADAALLDEGWNSKVLRLRENLAVAVEVLESVEIYPNGHSNMRVKQALAKIRGENTWNDGLEAYKRDMTDPGRSK